MPVYEVTDYFDVRGNPVDGFQINNQRRAGTIMARSDNADERALVEALIEAGHLNKQATEYLEAGILSVVDQGDGSIEIGETEEAWTNLEEAGEAGAYVDQPVTMTAEQVAEAEDDGYTAANYELAADQRPLLGLYAVDSDPDAKPFWRGPVLTQGAIIHRGQKVRAVLELRAAPEKMVGISQKRRGTSRGGSASELLEAARRPGVLRVESHVDGEYFGTFDFPDDFENEEELGLAVDGGLVDADPNDVQDQIVALDAFMDRGGVGAPAFLKEPPYGARR